MSFIPRVTPRWEAPEHLRVYIDILEHAVHGGLRIVVAAPPQHGKPLHEDTLVTMVHGGDKPIGALRVGDKVMSGFGTPTHVSAVYEQGELDVLRLSTRSGREVVAERSHRFLTPEGWRPAAQLVGSDRGGSASMVTLGASGHVADPIEAVAPAGRARCLCITVAQDDSFLANGLVTHNTESTMHAFAWWLKKWPHLRYAYATYSGDRAMRVGRRAKDVAQRAEVALSISNLAQWTTPAGGQVLWTSVGGGLTGEAIDGVMVIDDPLKDRAAAESATTRAGHKDWYHGSVESRLHPGTSLIVMATRWHHDDLSGYLVREQGFEYLNLKAIADEDRPEGDMREPGQALWEAKRPLAMLQERREASPWNFSSLYQGEPQPRGVSLFRTPHYYSDLPESGFRIIFGVDLAYSARTHADYSVCVELWVVAPPLMRKGQINTPKDHRIYVVDVQRKQVDAPSFTLTLKAKQSGHGGGRFYWYASGTELGSAQFMQQKGIALKVMDTKGRDKFTRAQVTSELWNLGCILVPESAERYPWVDAFVDEVTSFSGVNDPVDDQVDALVSGVDAAFIYLDDLGILGSGGRYKGT